jgi:hypothetical protein
MTTGWAADTRKEVSSVTYANSQRTQTQIPTEKSRGVCDPSSSWSPRLKTHRIWRILARYMIIANDCAKSKCQM